MIEGLLGSPTEFVSRALDALTDARLAIERREIDHLCYRSPSLARYEALRDGLRARHRLLAESSIANRPIATFALRDPVRVGRHTIPLLELPAPKPGRAESEGYEHIEVVVREGLAAFAADHEHLALDQTGLSSPHNPELRLAVPGGAVKFHERSLLASIQSERLAAWEATRASGSAMFAQLAARWVREHRAAVHEIYAALADFDPWPAGTLPLGIDLPESDLDLLCRFERADDFADALAHRLGHHRGFSLARGLARGEPYVLASLAVGSLPIEVFGQRREPRRQDAFVHLDVEARLLALTGDWSLDALRALKREGAKTEPAFAAFFALGGDDAYLALLDLAAAPRAQLEALARARLNRW